MEVLPYCAGAHHTCRIYEPVDESVRHRMLVNSVHI